MIPPRSNTPLLPRTYHKLAVQSPDALIFGHAAHPVSCGLGLEIGAGTVFPEINFTLPPMDINDATWGEVRCHYEQMISGVLQRAIDLDAPGVLVDFETLPPMTVRPEWGLDITRLLSEKIRGFHERYGLRAALRLTPNDSRDHLRPPILRSGPYWEAMVTLFHGAAEAGADMLAIESTGGKEICDQALMNADLNTLVYALGVLAPRDMSFLWSEIVSAAHATGIIPAGDTACGFANTAMVLAEQKLLPRVFAAIVRVASVPRSLVAYETGAIGPSKDCAYEGPYMKAIAGVPISMEGRTAAGAHLSSVGNIAQAACDCWSNESIQNVRLLSANAPVVGMEQLIYDCRLMNVVGGKTRKEVIHFRDWLVESDASHDPQAYVLKPEIVLKLSEEIIADANPYNRTCRAVRATVAALIRASQTGEVTILPRETKWLDRIARQADALPDSEADFIAQMRLQLADAPYLPEEYGL